MFLFFTNKLYFLLASTLAFLARLQDTVAIRGHCIKYSHVRKSNLSKGKRKRISHDFYVTTS